MGKTIAIILLSLIIGLLVGKQFFNSDNKSIVEESNIIMEKIEVVNKMITVEGSFAEIFTLEETQRLFFEMLPVKKKAIVLAKAKVFVVYDLSQLSYELDTDNKKVILTNIPEAQIIIEPDLKFHDLQANIIPFTEEELSSVNQRAIELLREQAKAEGLLEIAEKNLKLNLEKIHFVADALGWEVELKG